MAEIHVRSAVVAELEGVDDSLALAHKAAARCLINLKSALFFGVKMVHHGPAASAAEAHVVRLDVAHYVHVGIVHAVLLDGGRSGGQMHGIACVLDRELVYGEEAVEGHLGVRVRLEPEHSGYVHVPSLRRAHQLEQDIFDLHPVEVESALAEKALEGERGRQVPYPSECIGPGDGGRTVDYRHVLDDKGVEREYADRTDAYLPVHRLGELGCRYLGYAGLHGGNLQRNDAAEQEQDQQTDYPGRYVSFL